MYMFKRVMKLHTRLTE